MVQHTTERTTTDLREIIEQQEATIERLTRKVDALAEASGVSFAGACGECEDGLLIWKAGALSCSSCSFTHLV